MPKYPRWLGLENDQSYWYSFGISDPSKLYELETWSPVQCHGKWWNLEEVSLVQGDLELWLGGACPFGINLPGWIIKYAWSLLLLGSFLSLSLLGILLPLRHSPLISKGKVSSSWIETHAKLTNLQNYELYMTLYTIQSRVYCFSSTKWLNITGFLWLYHGGSLYMELFQYWNNAREINFVRKTTVFSWST